MLTLEQIKTLINGLKQGIDLAIRKAEKKTESTIAEVNKSIRGVLKRADEAAERADYAFDEAEQARYEAWTAQTTADEALPIITVSRISGGTGEVYEYMALRDGAVFSLRSTVEGPYSSDPAYLRYNGVTYPIYARNPSMYSLQSLNQIVGNERASRVFRVGMVTLMQYSSTRRAFISLNSYDMREFVRFTTINHGGDPNGGFVMAEEDEDGVVSSLRLRKYPSIPSASEGSSKRFDLVVNDDGMLKTIDPKNGGGSVIPAIETAEVDQIVCVSAVSENGEPTAWKAVDMKASKWRYIGRITTEEDVIRASLNVDSDGRPFSLSRVLIQGRISPNSHDAGGYVKPVLSGKWWNSTSAYGVRVGEGVIGNGFRYEVEIIDGRAFGRLPLSSLNSSNAWGLLKVAAGSDHSVDMESSPIELTEITSVGMQGWQDGVIGAGSYFDIWGVDI